MSESSSGGIGFAGMLSVLFIGLKLAGVIHWRWVWVLAPLWIAAIVGVLIAGIAFAFLVLCQLLKGKPRR